MLKKSQEDKTKTGPRRRIAENTVNRCLYNFIVFFYFYSGIVQINSLKARAK